MAEFLEGDGAEDFNTMQRDMQKKEKELYNVELFLYVDE